MTMLGLPEVLLLIALIFVPIGCITNWAAGFKQLQQGEPLLPYRARDNVPWGLLDLGVVLVAVTLIAGTGVAFVASFMGIQDPSSLEAMTPRNQAVVFLAFGTATLTTTAIGLGWMAYRYGRVDGFSWQGLASDLELGIRWFMMLVVPVIAMQLVLTRWFPTKHPLIEMLQASGDASFLPVAVYTAVVAAPLFEETMFRLLLQGWLEKLQITLIRAKLGITTKAETDALVVGGVSSSNLSPQPATADKSIDFDADPMPGHDQDIAFAMQDDDPASTRRRILWIPILVSSSLFSLAHFSHGPDWIPLFFLAIGLGFLYQRTGRIQPCIVVHVLVNALGVVQLWAAVRQGPP